MEKFKGIEGGVTAAKGFLAADTAAGIKYKDRTDMAMIYSQKDCKLAGTFTTKRGEGGSGTLGPGAGGERKAWPGSGSKRRNRQRLHRKRGHGLL